MLSGSSCRESCARGFWRARVSGGAAVARERSDLAPLRGELRRHGCDGRATLRRLSESMLCTRHAHEMHDTLARAMRESMDIWCGGGAHCWRHWAVRASLACAVSPAQT